MLGSTAVLAALVFAVTLVRAPIPSTDSDLYASIARSVQLHGLGVPSVIWNSPFAVDHVPFYGPVFFELVARSFRLFGVSLWSLRIVSVLGTVLLISGAALLARSLSPASDRWLWALTLLLLAPEVAATTTSGTMHSLAVGLEVLALGVFVRGLVAGRHVVLHGAAAGLLLTLAALTTPRTYPFIFAFLAAGAFTCGSIAGRGHAGRALAAAGVLLLLGVGSWGTWSQGNPFRWWEYMSFILTREDADVALLPSATRVLALTGSAPVTVTFAVLGACAAAVAMARRGQRPAGRHFDAVTFALATGWITLVLSVVLMNLPGVFKPYSVLPLFAVVLAAPYRTLRVDPRLVGAGLVGLIACDLAVSAVRYANVAATWSSRDPTGLHEFFRTHVPADSAVIGPDAPYFMAVEQSGSRYRSVSDKSLADWARWVPLLQPDATSVTQHWRDSVPVARFLVWRSEDTLPDGYECARPHAVAVYEPPPHRPNVLGPLRLTAAGGYPRSVLYRLPAQCPQGYDPSEPRLVK